MAGVPVHAPAETVHSCLARIIGSPPVSVARGGTRAYEDDPAAMLALVQPWHRGTNSCHQAEEVDFKVALPRLQTKLG